MGMWTYLYLLLFGSAHASDYWLRFASWARNFSVQMTKNVINQLNGRWVMGEKAIFTSDLALLFAAAGEFSLAITEQFGNGVITTEAADDNTCETNDTKYTHWN